jgi:aminocarboxymuconate-semialdehyde decarboxylase
MNIDIHAHIIVPEITRSQAPDEAWRPEVAWQNGKQSVDFNGKQINSTLRDFVDIGTILVEQEKADVDVVLLSPWSSLFRYDADPKECLRTCQIQNDSLARLVSDHISSMRAVGAVPLQDSSLAVAELERVMNQLGLAGVEIGTNVGGTYLGDPQFRPFWEAAEALGAFVEIHPVPGVGGSAKREYYLWNAYANPAETALTTAHMILSGLLEEHPNLKICLFHGGGHLPYQIGRLDRAYEVRPEARKKISAPPSTYLKKFYFDTVTHSSLALSYLVDLVGASQVLLGSDYPFDMGYEQPTKLVEELPDLAEDDKQAILGENARLLLGIETSPKKSVNVLKN